MLRMNQKAITEQKKQEEQEGDTDERKQKKGNDEKKQSCQGQYQRQKRAWQTKQTKT